MQHLSREHFGRIKAIFREVCDCAPDDRTAMLDSLCGDDSGLREDVEALLAHADSPSVDLENAASDFNQWLREIAHDLTSSDAQPDYIGPYRVIRLLGEGGMGRVYLAEQQRLHRPVAVKVIRTGFTTPAMMRRFEFEQEALGRLQHPGIAQIFESGIHKTGENEQVSREQPYFAMEFVEGLPLTRFAEQHDLSIRERLQLITKVCDAVEHAHQKGVIHRDLKPGNIFVTDAGQPKILDFGIARTINADIAMTTMQTDVGQLLGTLAYMSPEQVAADSGAIDTRSDVYAIGVMCYELLTGALPLDVGTKSIPETARLICETAPVRPSTIDRTFRGDIETIMLKALAKAPSMRYQSAAEMSADIRRYLANEPITARRPSTAYQIRRFARRNRVLVAGLTGIAVALIAGLTATGVALVRALHAEAELVRRADTLERVTQFQEQQLARIDVAAMGERLREDILSRRRDALIAADLDSATIEAELQTLQSALAGVNFTDVALRSLEQNLFDGTLDAIDAQFAAQPLIQASLLQAAADTMRTIGLLWAAEEPQLSALELRRRHLGNEHVDTINSLSSTGALRLAQGRLAEAEASFTEASNLSRRILGDDHPRTLSNRNFLGIVHRNHGNLDAAEAIWNEVLEARRRTLGNEHPDTLASLNNLGLLYAVRGRLADAEPLWLELLETQRRVIGSEHPEFINVLSNVAGLMHAQGRLDEAERYLREAIDTNRRMFGREHLRTLRLMNNMSAVLVEQGRFREAEPHCREALRTCQRILGDAHPDTLVAMSGLSVVLRELGRHEDAADIGDDLARNARATLPPNHANLPAFLAEYGRSLTAMGDFPAAERVLLEAVELAQAASGGAAIASDIVNDLVTLYDAWHEADPIGGHDTESDIWRRRLPPSQ